MNSAGRKAMSHFVDRSLVRNLWLVLSVAVVT
jgi:hypothetical protein